MRFDSKDVEKSEAFDDLIEDSFEFIDFRSFRIVIVFVELNRLCVLIIVLAECVNGGIGCEHIRGNTL